MRYLLILVFLPVCLPAQRELRLELRNLLASSPIPKNVEISGTIFELGRFAADIQKLGQARIASAARDWILIRLLSDRLRAHGDLIDPKELTDRAFGAALLAVPQLGDYPSRETSRAWWQVRSSFARSIAKKTTTEALQRFHASRPPCLSMLRLNVEAVFLSGWSTKRKRWDLAASKQRAEQARIALEEHGIAAAAQLGKRLVKEKRLANDAELFRVLRKMFGESEYTDVTSGASAVRSLYAQIGAKGRRPGQVFGPLLAPGGHWVVKIVKARKIGGIGVFPMTTPREIERVRSHYVSEQFRRWVDAVLAAHSVKQRKGLGAPRRDRRRE